MAGRRSRMALGTARRLRLPLRRVSEREPDAPLPLGAMAPGAEVHVELLAVRRSAGIATVATGALGRVVPATGGEGDDEQRDEDDQQEAEAVAHAGGG